jgi:hypothetical protein
MLFFLLYSFLLSVSPAEAGDQIYSWIPASAGMTEVNTQTCNKYLVRGRFFRETPGRDVVSNTSAIADKLTNFIFSK